MDSKETPTVDPTTVPIGLPKPKFYKCAVTGVKCYISTKDKIPVNMVSEMSTDGPVVKITEIDQYQFGYPNDWCKSFKSIEYFKLGQQPIDAPNIKCIPTKTQKEIAGELGWESEGDDAVFNANTTSVEGYEGEKKLVDVLRKGWWQVTGVLIDEDGLMHNWRPNSLWPKLRGKCLLRVTLLHDPTGVEVVLGQNRLTGRSLMELSEQAVAEMSFEKTKKRRRPL